MSIYAGPMTQSLKECLAVAVSFATERNDEYFLTEHLLVGLLKDPEIRSVFAALDVDLNEFEENLVKNIDSLEMLTKTRSSPNRSRREFVVSSMVEHTFEAALNYSSNRFHEELHAIEVLAGLLELQESIAINMLVEAGVSLLRLKEAMTQGPASLKKNKMATSGSRQEDDSDGATAANALEAYVVNLNERAKNGQIDPLIGRAYEVERTVQTLCRRRKNNPLLVGDPGVGKTAIAEGLALRIVNEDVPNVLRNATIFSLDIGALLAGTKYRGEFESRLKKLLKQIEETPGAILFIDEIHTIIGAGSASGSAVDTSNLLKPSLSSGALRVIGSTTYTEFRSIFEKDAALSRRFQKVDIKEPTLDDSVKILLGLRSHYESHHEVSYTDNAIQAAVDLSVRYITDRLLPDKAIDLLDEVGARQRILPKEERVEVIDVAEIEAMVTMITGIPVKKATGSARDNLRDLSAGIKEQIYGQDEAITSLVNAIKLNSAGLREGVRPMGSFLFTGPTGVGKTEVTRELSKQMNMNLIRFDMSEYMESHSVARLIGAPPGYVGHDKGGLLTEQVKKSPFSVLLLDELEKAHPDIFNILLQVMDSGSLTDSQGRKVDFSNTILVMTSNAGASHAARNSIGFTKQDNSSDSMDVVKRMFTPEFRNRLDRIVQFNALGRPEILRVVDKNLESLSRLLHAKGMVLEVSEEVRGWLAENGFDQAMGARPMSRLIEDRLKMPLSELLLFQDLEPGTVLTAFLKDGSVEVQVKLEDSLENDSELENSVV